MLSKFSLSSLKVAFICSDNDNDNPAPFLLSATAFLFISNADMSFQRFFALTGRVPGLFCFFLSSNQKS